MSERVKVGVAGVGAIGKNHARICAALEGVKLAAIYDTDMARAQELAAAYGSVAVNSLEEFAAIVDAGGDSLPDILLLGNYYDNNIQMGRYDADYGTILLNKGHARFGARMRVYGGFPTYHEDCSITFWRSGVGVWLGDMAHGREPWETQ